MSYSTTLTTACKNCNATHTVERDEDGAPDLLTEKCGDCSVELCIDCPSFKCSGCDRTYCLSHLTQVEDSYPCICRELVEGRDDRKACRACYPPKPDSFCPGCFAEVELTGTEIVTRESRTKEAA